MARIFFLNMRERERDRKKVWLVLHVYTNLKIWDPPFLSCLKFSKTPSEINQICSVCIWKKWHNHHWLHFDLLIKEENYKMYNMLWIYAYFKVSFFKSTLFGLKLYHLYFLSVSLTVFCVIYLFWYNISQWILSYIQNIFH